MMRNGNFRYTIKPPKRFWGVILLVVIIYAVVHLLLMGRHQTLVSPVLSIGGIEKKVDPNKFSSLIDKPANNSHLVHSVISPTRPRSKKKHRSIKAIPAMVRLSSNLPTLPPDVIRGIIFFAFFVGYPRSGQNIVGSILDAHPHIVMSNELNFFEYLSFFNDNDVPRAWAANLYNIIYQRSITDTRAGGLRNINSMSKGTQAIGSLWQGKFDKYIQVLGDMSGTLWEYLQDRITFEAQYQEFVKNIGVPVKVLHVLRNPYDAIAARADIVVRRKHVGNITTNTNRANSKINNYIILEKIIKTYFYTSKAVMKLIELIGRNNVLDIHLSDLIHNPKGTILSISGFLGVDAEDKYLQLCVEKVYKTTSRTRNLVVWPPELKMMVEHRMKGYRILQRYNFSSD